MRSSRALLPVLGLALAGLACGRTEPPTPFIPPAGFLPTPDPRTPTPVPKVLGGQVWIEGLPADGIRTAADRPASDVLVSLYRSERGGEEEVFVAKTSTDGDGRYGFEKGIPSGTYFLIFDRPEGHSFTRLDAGDDNIDSDAIPEGIDRGRTAPFEFDEAQTDFTRSAGLISHANTYVWAADDDAPACRDYNAGPVDCDWGLTGFDMSFDSELGAFVFGFGFGTPQTFDEFEFCVRFAPGEGEAGPGFCYSGFDQVVYQVDYGPAGEFLGSRDLPNTEAGVLPPPDDGSSEGMRLELWVNGDVLVTREGRVRAEVLRPPTEFSETPWIEDAWDVVGPSIP